MDRRVLGNIIKNRRKELKVTQEELALISDISVRQLSNIEQGKVNTTIDMLSKICETLGLKISIK